MVSRQFAIFIVVGIVCAVIDIALMQLLIWAGVYYLIATTAGFIAGLLANFLLHTHVTFANKYSHGVLLRYIGVVIVNYILTLLVVSLFHMWFDLPLLGKLFSLPMVAINGFLLSKYWVYR